RHSGLGPDHGGRRDVVAAETGMPVGIVNTVVGNIHQVGYAPSDILMHGVLMRRNPARLVKDDDVVLARGDAALHSRGVLRFARVDRNGVAGGKSFVYRLVQRFFAHRLVPFLFLVGRRRIVAGGEWG